MMKKEFVNYLGTLGISENLRQRIETIYEFYESVCPDEIKDIFVTDYWKNDGSREYEHLWFFSEKFAMEAKRFVTEDDFDLAVIKNQISHWAVKKNDYDFKMATERSRLYLAIRFGSLTCGLKASSGNCDHLDRIFRKYVISNLIK